MAGASEQVRDTQEPVHNEACSPDLNMAHVVQPRQDSLEPYGTADRHGADGGGPKVLAGPARR